MSKNNRVKGHVYERELAKLFRRLGYTTTKTSREASRLYDNCGYDLWGLPYLVQAKSGYKTPRIKPDELFKKMEEALVNFPKNEQELLRNYPMLVFNKMDGYKKEHHLVTLKYHDFVKMMIELNTYRGELTPEQADELYGELS